MKLTDQVADRARTFAPARGALTILSVPFFVLGVLVGIVWTAIAWAWAAVLVGVDQGRSWRADRDGEQ